MSPSQLWQSTGVGGATGPLIGVERERAKPSTVPVTRRSRTAGDLRLPPAWTCRFAGALVLCFLPAATAVGICLALA